MQLDTLGWVIAAVCALIVGLSKTGLAGIAMLSTVGLAFVVPPREASGAMLPLLIVGDLIGVFLFRRSANWQQLWRIFPWAGLGVVLGTLLLGRLDSGSLNRFIGFSIVLVAFLQVIRLWRGKLEPPSSPRVAAMVGVTAGVTTMLANAAGSIMSIYLLAMRLPKLEFVGTTAWFFLVVNLFKVPFSVGIGIINWDSLQFNLILLPFVFLGAALGKPILERMDQLWFERIALGFALLGGLKLLVF